MHVSELQIQNARAAQWVTLIGISTLALVFAQGAFVGFTLELLTTHQYVSPEKLNNPLYHGPTVELVVRRHWAERIWVVDTALCGCFLVGVLSAGMVTIALPHWRRWQRVAFVVVLPVFVGLVAAGLWWATPEHQLAWGLRQVASHTAANLAGGVLGLLFSKRLSSILIQVFVPPKPAMPRVKAAGFMNDPGWGEGERGRTARWANRWRSRG